MRAVLAPAVADVAFYETIPGLIPLLPDELRRTVEGLRPTPTAALLQLGAETIRRLDGTAHGPMRVGLAPDLPQQCSDECLEGCARLARERGVGVHPPLRESKAEGIARARRWGKTAGARLGELGLLGPGFVGAHGVWLTDDDIGRLADAGGAIAHNPASNLRLGSGIAAVREMLDRGVTVGLGTDGSMSSDNLNLFEAMRLAGLVGNVRFPHHTERWIRAVEVWRMATLGSAKALGLDTDVGAIEPGRKADLVLLRADSTSLRPLNDIVGALVYVESGVDVDTVLVDGRLVVQAGRVLTVDEARLRARAQEAAERVRAKNAAGWALAEALTPYITEACRAATALRRDPDRTEARTSLGLALYGLGDLDAAVEELRAPLRRQPDALTARLTLAAALVAKQDWAAARVELEHVLSAQPDLGQAHYSLGVVRYARGDLDGAIEEFRRVLAADPHHQASRYNLPLTPTQAHRA